MMTALEARAHCIAKVLNTEPESWGKAQADAAAVEAKRLLDAGKLSPSDFGDVVVHVSGNHSQMRQKLVSYGFIATKEADSAEKRQIDAAMKAQNAADDKAMEEMATPEPKKK